MYSALSGCLADNKKQAAKGYNRMLKTYKYNSEISAYYLAASQQNKNNERFEDSNNGAQSDVNDAKESLNPQTLENLRDILIT